MRYVIGAYLILHIVVMTSYTPKPEETELGRWLYAIQWFAPTFMLAALIPKIQRALNRFVGVNLWTGVCTLVIMTCVLTYFTNTSARWFAWSTLGLLVLVMVWVARANKQQGNISAWLLGAMVVLLAMGSWECIYQTGLLAYYDFFGCGIMSYYVTMAMQFMWIFPALIVVAVLYSRGLRSSGTWATAVYISTAVTATVIWFQNGMDIPLLWWQGPSGLEGPMVNEAARPLMISISRASQGFWLIGIASLFAGGKKRD